MPNIENVAWSDVVKGNYKNNPDQSVLIQIVDPDVEEPPVPNRSFHMTKVFRFYDLDTPSPSNEQNMISSSQAASIAQILQHCYSRCLNITVHCHAGLCRSGAVAEVGEIMGFKYVGNVKRPNIYVKKLLMKALGWPDYSDDVLV